MHEENNMWNELEGVGAEALIFNEQWLQKFSKQIHSNKYSKKIGS